MSQSRFLAVLIGMILAILAVPVLAAEPSEVAAELELRGYYIESGSPVDFAEMESLVEGAKDLGFVVLAADPQGGTDLFAEDVLAFTGRNTVVVVSPNEFAAISEVFDDATITKAAEAASREVDEIPLMKAFADALPANSTKSGGSSGFRWFLGVLAAAIGFSFWRSSRNKKVNALAMVDEARNELVQQLDAVANQIVELTDRVEIGSNPQATEFFRTANDTYSDVAKIAETAMTPQQLEESSDRLDQARWQLEAAEAVLEGRQLPPEPEDRPAHCFFDPSHKAGTEAATLKTPAGEKEVSVCRECADKLRKGETPTPRSINVGGRPIPAPQAPRTHGGGGHDRLDVFSILVGGLGSGVDYRLGRGASSRRTGRSGGIGAGLGSLGRRSKSTGTASRNRGTPPRSSTPRPPVTGRARKRRRR